MKTLTIGGFCLMGMVFLIKSFAALFDVPLGILAFYDNAALWYAGIALLLFILDLWTSDVFRISVSFTRSKES